MTTHCVDEFACILKKKNKYTFNEAVTILTCAQEAHRKIYGEDLFVENVSFNWDELPPYYDEDLTLFHINFLADVETDVTNNPNWQGAVVIEGFDSPTALSHHEERVAIARKLFSESEEEKEKKKKAATTFESGPSDWEVMIVFLVYLLGHALMGYILLGIPGVVMLLFFAFLTIFKQ